MTDVIVIGAGTAGAAAAALCARHGMRTVCVEHSLLAEAGARWVNGVPAWSFDVAGFPAPEGAELLGAGGPFHLVAGYGPRRIVIEDHGVLEVDMRALVARLQRAALEAGAELREGIRVTGWDGSRLQTDAGPMAARFVIDASGLTGARLLDPPRVAPKDLCAAAQQVHRIADAAAARAFFAQHETPLGQVLCFAGIAGGYSILNLRADRDHVSFLTGSIPALGHPSGKAILDDFVHRHAWVGERLYGGARVIPLRRPFDRLAAGPIAAIGDAGSQVFPAHGSGIGAGMVAARMLADELALGGTPHTWAVTWQRKFGGLYAAYDLFRRFSSTLSPADLERLMTSGLMDPVMARAAMAQELPRLDLRAAARKALALPRAPRLAVRMSGVLARMAAVLALYKRYPAEPARLPAWSRRVARVFGDPPDPV
jgi:flavin-dependent dehydrogenase